MKTVVIACAILLVLLLACGKSGSEKTTISWWQFWTSPDVAPTIRQLVDKFEKEDPNINVELGELTWSDGHEKIVISLAAGKGPDLVELGSDWVAEFAAADKLLDISDKIGDLRNDLQMWEPVTYDGGVYGLPWMLGTRVLFGNRKLLREAGYEDDFQPKNWDELLTAARAVNSLSDEYHGFGSNAAERHTLYKKFLPFFWSAGGRVFDSTGTATQFDSEAGRESLQYYLQLSDAGVIETQARLDEYFAAGQVGFVISGDWLVRKILKSYPELDFYVQVLPGPDSTRPGISFAGGEYLAVNAASQHTDAAYSLAQFLVQPKNDEAFCVAAGSFTPANRKAAGVTDTSLAEVATVFRMQLDHARSTPVNPHWVYIEEAIEKGVEQALYGEMTYQEALTWIDKRCAEILAGSDE
jgi:multiple sugar transport system substrate-binding protein